MINFIFDSKGFSMDEIIDIVDGWSDDVPPMWSIVVYSRNSGKQIFPRTLQNLAAMHHWLKSSSDLKLQKMEHDKLTSVVSKSLEIKDTNRSAP